MTYLLHSVIYLSIGAVIEIFDLVMSSSWKIPAQAEPSYEGDDDCRVPQLVAHGQDVAQFHHLNPL